MAENCLSCEEIRERICVLLDEISNLQACEGAKVTEGGITFDYSGQISSKHKALDVLLQLEDRVCPKGAGQLYEFVHTPCSYPVNCDTGCSTSQQRSRNRRRYR